MKNFTSAMKVRSPNAQILVFFVLALSSIFVFGCKSRQNQQAIAPDKAAAESLPGSTTSTDKSDTEKVTSKNPVPAGTSFPQLNLVESPITTANICPTGDLACNQNGQDFACSTSNGDFGVCMNNRFVGCECRGIANSPFLSNNSLPNVASGRICSGSSTSPVCNTRPMGSMCSTQQDGTGFCVARTFSGDSCSCAPVTTEKSLALGNVCERGVRANDPCIGLREGNSCLTSANSAGFCALASDSSGTTCGCLAATKKPLLPERICYNSNDTDLGCRSYAAGMPCVLGGNAVGVCQVSTSVGSNTSNCKCAATSFQFFKPIAATCSSNSPRCVNRPVGESCLSASGADLGRCLLTDGNADQCACIFAFSPTDPSPNPVSVAITARTTSSISLGWASAGGSTAGFLIASSTASIPLSCSGGTAVPANATSYSATGLTIATQYFFRICSFNGGNIASSGVGLTASTLTGGTVVLLTDNFDRADNTSLGANWTEVVGDLAVASNSLKSNIAAIAANIAVSQENATDVILESDYTSSPVNTGGYVGLLARYTGPGDSGWYLLQLVMTLPTPTLAIWRSVSGGGFVNLSQTTTGIPASGRMKFSVIGSSLVGYINNVSKLTVTDTSIVSPGKFGVRVVTGAARMDNFNATVP